MSTTCTVEEKEVGPVLLLKVSGRLDALSSQLAERRVKECISMPKPLVILDFSEVDYVSSAGMRMLLSVYKYVENSSGRLAVCALDDEVLGVLKMSGFEGIFCVYSSQQEALQSFSS